MDQQLSSPVWRAALLGDHDREVREGDVLGGDPALEMENQAGMGAEYDYGGVDLESELGDHLVT